MRQCGPPTARRARDYFIGLIFVVSSLSASPAASQVRFTVAGGLAIPWAGSSGRHAGPATALGIGYATTSALDAKIASYVGFLNGSEESVPGYFGDGDVVAYHAGIELNAGGWITDHWRLHGLVATGPWWLENLDGDPNPYGVTWGASLGVGAERPLRKFGLVLVLRQDLIFSDFAAREYGATTVASLLMGLTYPARSPPWRRF